LIFNGFAFLISDMIGQSSKTGTTFFTRARRNASDGLFYFQDISSLYYTIPIADGFSLLKFTQPGLVNYNQA
jgi:hypothetical protein